MKREEALKSMVEDHDEFDFVIVGGGATGLGCAVDAATRGYSVALFEQSDFAKATSSRSTKLVHGGVRYLKQGNISLVLEALKERGLLCENAIHLVSHQAFIVPLYKWWSGPFYGIGLKVYDVLAGKLGLEKSKSLSREETLKRIPTLEKEGLYGGVIYYDGQFDDARLATNLAQTVFDHNGLAINYMKVKSLQHTNDIVSGVVVEDVEGKKDYNIKAKCVINATGIFSDSIRKMDDSEANNIIAASQGVHIVLPKEFIPKDAAIMVPHTSDGRVLFAVPWHDFVIVGTTDTPVEEHKLEPIPLKEEIEFILINAKRYLSKAPTNKDILSVFAGLRPLVKSGDSNKTAALSRDHTIVVSEKGLLTIAGGKWTTYRKMAEDTIDHAEVLAGHSHQVCKTHHLKIHGWSQAKVTGPPLLHLFGSDAKKIIQLAKNNKELLKPICKELPYSPAEMIWSVREEMARSVEDVLARRTRSLLLNAQASINIAPAVGQLVAKELGHDSAWAEKSATDFIKIAKNYLPPKD